jgi:hypothetical protein
MAVLELKTHREVVDSFGSGAKVASLDVGAGLKEDQGVRDLLNLRNYAEMLVMPGVSESLRGQLLAETSVTPEVDDRFGQDFVRAFLASEVRDTSQVHPRIAEARQIVAGIEELRLAGCWQNVLNQPLVDSPAVVQPAKPSGYEEAVITSLTLAV